MAEDKFSPKVINIMESSLEDLKVKGTLSSIGEIYNPNNSFEQVYHFTPHEKDLLLAEHFKKHKIELIPYSLSSPRLVNLYKTVRKMISLVKNEKVDIIRGRLPYLGSLMGAIAAKLTGKPFAVSLGGDNRIVQERNGEYNYNSKFLSYNIEWATLRLASSIIVPNEYTCAYVEKIIGPTLAQKKMTVIPWISAPIDATPVELDDERLTKINPARKLIIIIGFLNKYKFTDVLYNALEQMAETGGDSLENTDFVFCGDGPLREEGVARFGKRDNIHFFGWTEKKVVQELMRRADVVLVPMSGFVLLEAASLGKSVITSNVEWHSEIVSDKESGLIVDPHAPDQWVKAIDYLLSRDDKATEMGAKLKDVYQNKYASDKVIEIEFELYKKLAGKAKS